MPTGTVQVHEPQLIASGLGLKTGEGPVWDARTQRLYFIDVLGKNWRAEDFMNAHGCMYVYDPATRATKCLKEFDEPVGCIVPTSDPHMWLVSKRHDVVLLDVSGDTGREMRVVATIPSEYMPSMADFRSNDGKATPGGGMMLGYMHSNGAKNDSCPGRLFSMEAASPPADMLGPTVKISNGLDWDMTRKAFYFIDSLARSVEVFACDERGVPVRESSGEFVSRKTLVKIPEDSGIPDGMCLDANGDLWVAHFGGSMVACYDRLSGEMKAKVVLPVEYITCCAFGGEDLSTMYITTATHEYDCPQGAIPESAGDLFAIDIPGVRGMQPHLWGGAV